jgi:hypothetical protein
MKTYTEEQMNGALDIVNRMKRSLQEILQLSCDSGRPDYMRLVDIERVAKAGLTTQPQATMKQED